MDKKALNDVYAQPLHPDTVKAVLEKCGIDPGGDYSDFHLLDFGCGSGRYMEAFATRLPMENVVGVEIDSDQVQHSRCKGFACYCLDPQASELPFADQQFDVIFSSNVIEHIPRINYVRLLGEIHRVLRPGGRFLVGTPNYPIKRVYDVLKAFRTRQYRYYFLDDPTHVNKLSFSRLESDLRPHFREVSLEPTHLFFERKVRWLRRPKVRRTLRSFGDKIVGVCVK